MPPPGRWQRHFGLRLCGAPSQNTGFLRPFLCCQGKTRHDAAGADGVASSSDCQIFPPLHYLNLATAYRSEGEEEEAKQEKGAVTAL